MEKEFTFRQDWDNDGMLEWHNAKTLRRYRELNDDHANIERLGCFFAFGDTQFEAHLAALIERGVVTSVKDIVSGGCGLYGTPQGIEAVNRFYADRDKMIAKECDPQEVYCYEFNNHESCIAYDGDLNAIRLIIGIFGIERAKQVKRFCAFYPIESLTKGGGE